MAVTMEQEANPAVHTLEFTVTEKEIDRNHHLNNVVCVQWIQDIAANHSNITGSTRMADELGAAWMVRVQHVEYKNQAFLGDVIQGETWVSEYSKVSSNRRCKFTRVSDGKEIFSSVSTWVLVNVKTGRPMGIPEEMKAFFRKKG